MTTNGTIEEIVKTIKPKQIYAPADLVRMGTFPWARDHRTIVKLIERDRSGENLLQANIEGEGRGLRYQIEGKNIIKFLNKYGTFLTGTVRKTKTYGRKK